MEVLSHFYLALDLNFVNSEIMENIKSKASEISNQLNALRRSQLNKS